MTWLLIAIVSQKDAGARRGPDPERWRESLARGLLSTSPVCSMRIVQGSYRWIRQRGSDGDWPRLPPPLSCADFCLRRKRETPTLPNRSMTCCAELATGFCPRVIRLNEPAPFRVRSYCRVAIVTESANCSIRMTSLLRDRSGRYEAPAPTVAGSVRRNPGCTDENGFATVTSVERLSGPIQASNDVSRQWLVFIPAGTSHLSPRPLSHANGPCRVGILQRGVTGTQPRVRAEWPASVRSHPALGPPEEPLTGCTGRSSRRRGAKGVLDTDLDRILFTIVMY